ncbi:UPF0057-domain-containing protein [Aaosphaeria arxii CBS 175.79]|uniref:UPF0057-domain-containing protein n=1 Tax=Aaosphaeria arxii CBS 175.79 TaxID=1450172 RepID=A0A6A5XAQ4_9PLEO|nr:UPF0057-domain-containing protein [Aaosphaeria arxii CBS 175.79]KAF2009926.1 UPF0057-domain-containing protein [Aaosphaeria arxii CBS 175.79]
MCGTDCFLMLLSVLFPPIGVWVKRGVCSADSLINIALCCLGFLPGLLHAWYIILQNPDPYDYEGLQDGERAGDGSVTYYYVARGGQQQQQPQPQQLPQSYGTLGSQPAAGQFPGQQQTGTTNAFPGPTKQSSAQPQHGVAGAELGGEGSSGQPAGPPPTYADVIKGDNKIQHP